MPRKAVVVDDDKVTLAMLSRILETSGFAVVSAADGQTGLDLIFREIPDLVLADLLLPRLDGFGICAALRRDPRFGRTKIVIMTALKNFALQGEARDSGANAFLPKPFPSEALYQMLKHLFPEA